MGAAEQDNEAQASGHSFSRLRPFTVVAIVNNWRSNVGSIPTMPIVGRAVSGLITGRD